MKIQKKIIVIALIGVWVGLCSAETQLQVSVVDAITSRRILPDTPLTASGASLSAAATPGEYEPLSWVIRSEKPLPEITVKVMPLRSAAGDEIPADYCDVKLVKCWYQSGNADGNCSLSQVIEQDKSRRILVPELLLHDDDLVIVDQRHQRNFLRLRFPDGDSYWDISSTVTDDSSWQKPLWMEQYPVDDDASELLPFDLPAETNQQFWLTVQAPSHAAPGLYSGSIEIASGGALLASLPLELTVLPFTLTEPRTNYDLDRKFISSIYYQGFTHPEMKASLNAYFRSPTQHEADLKNMIAHGVTAPTFSQLLDMGAEKGQQYPYSEKDWMHFDAALQLRKQLGIGDQPVFFYSSYNISLDDTIQADEAGLSLLKSKAQSIIDRVQRNLGHADVYFYGYDEGRSEEILRRQIPFWRAIQEVGGKVWASGYKPIDVSPGNFAVVGDVLDVLNCANAADPEEAAKWHGTGKRILSYANPQVGFEDPEIYRRNYGLGLYLANYDGAANFSYISALGSAWNDFDMTSYRDHCFVYPTRNDVVDTIQWEGYREGIDDIRYATTLREAIRDHADSGSAEAAAQWLNQLTIQPTSDLRAIRQQMIEWIMVLRDDSVANNGKQL